MARHYHQIAISGFILIRMTVKFKAVNTAGPSNPQYKYSLIVVPLFRNSFFFFFFFFKLTQLEFCWIPKNKKIDLQYTKKVLKEVGLG